MDCREGLAHTAHSSMGGRRSSFVAATLLAILLALSHWPLGSACLYERAVLPNWLWDNSTYDEDLKICDNTVYLEKNFVTPIYLQDDPDYADILYVRYEWTADSECRIKRKFDSGSQTRSGDVLHVYEGSTYYSYDSSNFPTSYLESDEYEIIMYFITFSGTPTDVGFTGTLKEFDCPVKKRRRRGAGMPAPEQRRKRSVSTPVSERPGYRGQVTSRDNIPLMMDMWKAKLASNKTAGELCDHSCDVRLLMNLPECCKHWHENFITPTPCPGRVNAGESDVVACPSREPLDAGRLRKRSLAEQRRGGGAGKAPAADGWRGFVQRILHT